MGLMGPSTLPKGVLLLRCSTNWQIAFEFNKAGETNAPFLSLSNTVAKGAAAKVLFVATFAL